MNTNVRIRKATQEDTKKLFAFIYDLAVYQGIENRLTITEEGFHTLLGDPQADSECIVAESNEEIIGFSIFSKMNINRMYQKTPALYIDEMYVIPEYRKQGTGRKMFYYLEKIAMERGYNRIEWWVVENNTDAEKFYLNLNAVAFPEYKVWRLKEDQFHHVD